MHALGIAILGEAEMEVGVEPAVVRLAELLERSEFDHGITSCRQNGATTHRIKFLIGNGSAPDTARADTAASVRRWLGRVHPTATNSTGGAAVLQRTTFCSYLNA